MAEESASQELSISREEAAKGARKVLVRGDRKLEVVIPPGTGDGRVIKLTGALRITDGRTGNILVTVRVKPSAFTGVVTVSDNSFQAEVIREKLPVAVDFWAAWCGPCRMISPIMEKLAEEYSGRVKICKLNVDENQTTAGEYRVMSIPTILFFKNGKVADTSVGAVPESDLKEKLNSLL